MAQPLIVTLPPNLDLDAGCVIRVTALNPTTGATVAGVTVRNIMLEVDAPGIEGPEQIGEVLLLQKGFD